MMPQFSPHAQTLFQDILFTIEDELSYEDSVRWHDKIITAVAQLEDFPLSHPTIPVECYHTVPSNPERLHQLIVSPYRIVYEIVDSECHILSIRHGHMLVTLDDTNWH